MGIDFEFWEIPAAVDYTSAENEADQLLQTWTPLLGFASVAELRIFLEENSISLEEMKHSFQTDWELPAPTVEPELPIRDFARQVRPSVVTEPHHHLIDFHAIAKFFSL